jgi:superoxide reductase
MQLVVENTVDASKEQHVPVIEKTAKGYLVKVGSVPHPMEEKHYIVMIELVADGRSCRRFLKPGDKPEAEFFAIGESASGGETSANKVEAREYCNLHGLWRS